MTKLILMTLVVFAGTAHAENLELRMACKAAAKNMGSGTGGTVYYPNGATLTTDAGIPGANWYHPNGATLTTDVSVPGANYYYANGATFSTDTGVAGANWYYKNGGTITTDAPALTPQEMAELACDLIQIGE
jgi:hypothetical protein